MLKFLVFRSQGKFEFTSRVS